MFSKTHFEIALLKAQKSKSDVAGILGISPITLYRKISGESDFFRDEIQKISEYLGLSTEEKEDIFFND